MPQNSTLLNLPYIQPAQAQKHITHNEALRALDGIVHLSVVARDHTDPPASPVDGDRYIIAAPAGGDWAGREDQIALYDGGWVYLTPNVGWSAYVVSEDRDLVWRDDAWAVKAASLPDVLGLGTAADPQNRLSVASGATLLTHEGAGHQLKVNKAADTDTASLLFQSGFTGHAEMGLAGNTGFAIKVSGDGNTWHTALEIDPDTGECAFPETSLGTGGAGGLVSTTGPTDTDPDAVIRAQDGYLKGTILGAVTLDGNGVPTGGVIERGSNANGDFVRFADGTQICTSGDIPTGGITNPAGALFQSNHLAWTFPAPFAPGVPPILVGESGNTGAWPTFAPHGVLSTGFKATAIVSIGVGLNLRLCAIGRWA